MAQSIGRVIRLNKSDSDDIKEGNISPGVVSMYRKSTGYCVVPVHKDYGKKCKERLTRIVNDIFIEGGHANAVCEFAKCPLSADKVRKCPIIHVWETKSHP